MWIENPLWGEDAIAAELAKLGHHVSPRTVAKYRPARLSRGRGQKWSTFIRNHLGQTWAADWFTIVTVRAAPASTDRISGATHSARNYCGLQP
jgi:hypothetical protein